MLVKFKSDAGNMTMFGEVAVDLLKLMGQTGALPGALLAKDIPAALERLKRGVATPAAAAPSGGKGAATRSRKSRSGIAPFRWWSCSSAA